MRVLVTGGSGFLGHFVVEALRELHEITVLDRVAPTQDVAFRQVDVLDLEALQGTLPGHDAIIHLAAIDAGNPFPDETYFRTNEQGSWNVLHAARASGIAQGVIASSSSVYGVDADNPPDILPMDETHPRRPGGVYGLSKLLIEETAQSFTRGGDMQVICLRPAHIVRPATQAPILLQLAYDDGHEDTGTLARRLQCEPYGALPALRAYVRSRDVARAFVAALEYRGQDFDTFNITAGDSMGRASTLARMAALYDCDLPLAADHPYDNEPTASVFDARRARALLGWSATDGWGALEDEYA